MTWYFGIPQSCFIYILTLAILRCNSPEYNGYLQCCFYFVCFNNTTKLYTNAIQMGGFCQRPTYNLTIHRIYRYSKWTKIFHRNFFKCYWKRRLHTCTWSATSHFTVTCELFWDLYNIYIQFCLLFPFFNLWNNSNKVNIFCWKNQCPLGLDPCAFVISFHDYSDNLQEITISHFENIEDNRFDLP